MLNISQIWHQSLIIWLILPHAYHEVFLLDEELDPISLQATLQSHKLNVAFIKFLGRLQNSMKKKDWPKFLLFRCLDVWNIFLNFRAPSKNHYLVLQWVVYSPSDVHSFSCSSFLIVFGKYTRSVLRTLSNIYGRTLKTSCRCLTKFWIRVSIDLICCGYLAITSSATAVHCDLISQ